MGKHCGSRSKHPVNEEEQEIQGEQFPVEPGYLSIYITGICAVVHERDEESLLIIMPRADERRPTHGEVIPEHYPWLVARAETFDADSSRDDDFRIVDRKWALFVLHGERLTIKTGEAQTIVDDPFTDPEAIRFWEVCANSAIDRAHARPTGSDKVAAQIAFPAVELEQAARTRMKFDFDPNCPDLSDHPPLKRVTHVGRVKLKTGANSIILESTSFDGLPRNPIVLTPAAEGTVLVIGNTPLPDVQDYLQNVDHGDHEGRDIHFELYYDLVQTQPSHELTAAVGHLTDEPIGPVPRVGNCPKIVARLA